jgi:DNA-binding response OmpR family regulator
MKTQTILIVNDDTEIIAALKENLQILTGHYVVKTAANGEAALKILQKDKIDIMVLDLQLPVMNGIQLLAELNNKRIWLPSIVLSDEKIDKTNKEFQDFGIIEFYKKPFLMGKIVFDIDDILQNREKADLIKNFSLPAIMQLINMEKRTGIITVKIGKKDGKIFFRNGKLMDINIEGLSAEEALMECIHSLYDDREITIEYIEHRKKKKIDMSLIEMVMEASRINDEKRVPQTKDISGIQGREVSQNDRLSTITALLNSLKELDSYIITNREGEILKASSKDVNDVALNSSIYLWVIGNKMSDALKLGKPGNIIYYRSAKKRFISKFKDYILIFDLTEITKFSVFKKKLYELLEKLILE